MNMTQLSEQVTIFAELSIPPGNITCTKNGCMFLSLHQFYNPQMVVAELVEGQLKPFPTSNDAELVSLETILGIQVDANDTLWMLDNGNQNESLPKLVAWDTHKNQLARIIYLPPPITLTNSFINDLAVDLTHNVVYISDPIQGNESALIRVDLKTGLAQRILQGHLSVIPEEKDLFIEETPVEIQQADGSVIRPHLGVNGLVLDAQNEWLYFCPMHSTSMYRIKSADLANPHLRDIELAEKVEKYSNKPICDGISIDQENNLYVGDLSVNGVGVIKTDRSYQLLISDNKLSWIDSFSFGSDGYLYCNSNQLHRSAPLNRGKNVATSPYYIFQLQPLAKGVIGR